MFNENELRNKQFEVEEGKGVFAYIEYDGLYYEGGIPGISDIIEVFGEKDYNKCVNKLKYELNDSFSITFPDFKQEISYEEIKDEYPEAKIVFIPIKR